jgi:hypothetical protein
MIVYTFIAHEISNIILEHSGFFLLIPTQDVADIEVAGTYGVGVGSDDIDIKGLTREC